MHLFLSFWWLIPILLAVVFYKVTLRVFCGMVIIPEDKLGLVVKKWALFGSNTTLKDGHIMATTGEAGYQVDPLNGGVHWKYWLWQYDVKQVEFCKIEKGTIGLVLAKDGKELEQGKIIAPKTECANYTNARIFMQNGFKGKQSAYLNPGIYKINFNLFEVYSINQTAVTHGTVAIVTTSDGAPLGTGEIAGISVDNSKDAGHNNFQNFDKFLMLGGQRGLQPQVLQAGTYSLNTWAITVEQVPMTEVPIGCVGVVISYIGPAGTDVTGVDFKHGNIVNNGEKGVWIKPLDPGKYALNTKVMKIEIVPTTNIVLNWATGRNESHKLDEKLSTITVRSKDGFKFNLDVSQIIHVPSTEAPKVIARFGSMLNLVSQVLEPTIGNYFRNSAQSDDIISFLRNRKEQQDKAKAAISKVLEEYDVNAVDTLIGDINPPEDLMKTLTDRKIAEEMNITYTTQKKAAEKKQELKSAEALADMQPQIVSAKQGVMIAENNASAEVKKAEGQSKAKKQLADGDAYYTVETGKAEAGKITAIGQANADAYKEQVKAMGEENFAQFKIVESLGLNKIKIMPDMLIMGGESGNSNPVNGLMGFKLLEMMDTKKHTLAQINKKLTDKNPSDKDMD